MNILSHDSRGKSTVETTECLSGTPSGSLWGKWGGGIIAPLVLIIFGLKACITQTAILIGKNSSPLDLTGNTAVAMGIALLSIAFFLHFHFFWSLVNKLFLFADLGKILSALVFIGSFGYVIWKVAMR